METLGREAAPKLTSGLGGSLGDSIPCGENGRLDLEMARNKSSFRFSGFWLRRRGAGVSEMPKAGKRAAHLGAQMSN